MAYWTEWNYTVLGIGKIIIINKLCYGWTVRNKRDKHNFSDRTIFYVDHDIKPFVIITWWGLTRSFADKYIQFL